MLSRVTALILVPCLLLMSCTAARPQPPVRAPVMSAELQQAFEGPLCRRLDGVDWPCSDTDGRLWKEWYAERQAAGVLGVGPDRTPPTVWQAAAGVLLIGAVGMIGVLASGASSYHSHYHSRITTRCSYGRSYSTCTTKSW